MFALVAVNTTVAQSRNPFWDMFHREASVLCERLQVAFDSFGFVVKSFSVCVCVCVRALVAEVRASVESFSSESAQACLRLKRAVFYFLLSLFFSPPFSV